MSTSAYTSEPANELERLIADLPRSGLQAFIFGGGCWVAHLDGVTTHLFRGPADRRWWHAVLGDDAASRTMNVRVDEITGVRFERGLSMFPSFPGQEGLGVHFLGPGGRTCCTASCTICMTVSGCGRRSWRPGRRCANGTATATSPGSIGADSCLRLSEPSRRLAFRCR